MTPERWQQVDDIFQAAMELRIEDRSVFVESACGGDDELRREVESLITADKQGLSLVEEPAFQVAAGLLAQSEPQLAAGDSISHYEIIDQIGKGGMGEVYLAKDKWLNRRVALKLLPSSYTQHKDRLRRFQQEAQAASALNHPNILTIHELGQVDGQQFIATELVEGETLRDRLKRAPLNLAETLDIAIQIAGALAAAHRAGIVHRDIKPENIMLRHDGYVKVLDFGLAKLTEQHEPTTQALTAENVNVSSGLVMGTVKYMSPEQARGQQVDPRSDIFSFGVVLYEMLEGHAPFEGKNSNELIANILKREPPPLANAPQEVQRLVAKALHKKREERYQTIQHLLVALNALSDNKAVTSTGRIAPRTVDTSESPTTVSTVLSIEFIVSQIRVHKSAATVVLISMVILFGGIAYSIRKWMSRRAASSDKLEVTMLTTTGNLGQFGAAISRDGKYVAYRRDNAGLLIRDLSTNQETQVTSVEERTATHPVFSPDRKYLYFERSKDDNISQSGLQLYRKPILGGPAEKIIDYVSGKISLSPDGNNLAFIRQDFKQGLSTLVIANADGTDQQSIVIRKAPNYFPTSVGEGPSWAPDGKKIVYVAQNASDGYERIFEVSLETKSEKPLTSQKWDHGIVGVTWLPDSSGIVFVAGNTSISAPIWLLSYPSGDLQRITNEGSKYYDLSVAGDSNTLVTTQIMDFVELWIAPDADASRARRVMPGRHDGFYGMAWTPDGRIVYTRETSGNSDIWIANADGTNQRQLTTDAHQDVRPVVTNDGRYIVFQSNRAGTDHIWRMDIDGSNQKQMTFGQVERIPICSPDAEWVVYMAWESGKATMWKVPVEGGAPQEIIGLGCGFPAFSHDGKLIACGSEKRVLIFSFEKGEQVAAVELPADAAQWIGSWTRDDRGIIYAVFSDRIANYWIKPIDGSVPKQLTFFTPDQLAASGRLQAVLSPNGKDLLYSHYDRKSDVVMITGLK
jgi:eukaryotic-like serine/threonine-protein kinase